MMYYIDEIYAGEIMPPSSVFRTKELAIEALKTNGYKPEKDFPHHYSREGECSFYTVNPIEYNKWRSFDASEDAIL